MERFDIVIIGTGIDGLTVGKTYLEIYPEAKLLLVDKASSIGGVWAKERLYPGLRTNHTLSAYELSDFPMDGYGLKPDEHIPGTVMHQYLTDVADKCGLIDRIRLDTAVKEATYLGAEGWTLLVQSSRLPLNPEAAIHASKLVVATGLSSQAFTPSLRGADRFARPLCHTKDYAQRAAELASAGTVAVLGGGKSAMDVAFYNAAKGVKVHWIIRKSGRGPAWTAPLRATPLKIRTDKIVGSRLISWFSPCIWAEDGYPGIRYFLHRTWIGRLIVRKFFNDMEKDIAQGVGYKQHPETAKLRPWTHIFWHGAQVSTLNFGDDVMGYIRNGQVEVHIDDVDHLDNGRVCLSGGTELNVDGLICATGWRYKPDISFKNITDEELGLPSFSKCSQAEAVAQANAEIDRQFPLLKNPPPEWRFDETINIRHGEPTQPARLFRFSVPPRLWATRNIAFPGLISSPITTSIQQVQALWVVAYLNNEIDSLRQPEDPVLAEKQQSYMEWETILHSEFCRRRTPLGTGMIHADISPDSVPYIDILFRDLGMPKWRKSSSWKEMLYGYGPWDYAGMVQEWLEIRRRKGKDRS